MCYFLKFSSTQLKVQLSRESTHKKINIPSEACQVPIYIKNSMHVSMDDITASEVIYMFQSPGRAAAAAFSMPMCFCLPWTASSTASFLGPSGTHCSLPAGPIMERGLLLSWAHRTRSPVT